MRIISTLIFDLSREDLAEKSKTELAQILKKLSVDLKFLKLNPLMLNNYIVFSHKQLNIFDTAVICCLRLYMLKQVDFVNDCSHLFTLS